MCVCLCMFKCWLERVHVWTLFCECASGHCVLTVSHTKLNLSFLFSILLRWQPPDRSSRMQPFSLIPLFSSACHVRANWRNHLANFSPPPYFVHPLMQIKNNICISQSNPRSCFCCQTVNNKQVSVWSSSMCVCSIGWRLQNIITKINMHVK